MKVTIIGTGYVGLVTGACLAQMGNTVTCVDVNAKKIEDLKKGILPIYEPGLESIVNESFRNETLKFTTSIEEGLEKAAIVLIAVGTPMGSDGSADLAYVLSAARDIGRHMRVPTVVVTKSTVPVGTSRKVRECVAEALAARGAGIPFFIASNPEFLKEGAAVGDFMSPDRVVIGTDSKEASEALRELYRPFLINHDRIIEMDIASAEMTKYASNALLATKISFMNEIANICELIGADVNMVRVGVGSDSRIGYNFLYAGSGYGGSCFPKDIRALQKTSMDMGYEARILGAVENVNRSQKLAVVRMIVERFGPELEGMTFAVWGLAFKPGTDDMREAPSVDLVRELTARKAKVVAYDPKAMNEAREHYLKGNPLVSYAASKYEAAKGADALVLMTEWREFRSPDFDELAQMLKRKVIFDGRNQYNREYLEKHGIEYHEIGYRRNGEANR
jgi:UDPglucose 6-dehydrogenase